MEDQASQSPETGLIGSNAKRPSKQQGYLSRRLHLIRDLEVALMCQQLCV